LFAKESVATIGLFLRRYPRRSTLMVMLLILSGLAEGVGVVTLLPLLEIAVAGPAEEPSRLSSSFEQLLSTVGLQPSVPILLTLIVVGMTAKAAFLWLAMKQVGFTVARIATDLRLMLIRALLRARWSYFSTRPVGHFANAISNEAHRASGAYREMCFVLAGSVQVIIYVAIALLISWETALLALLAGGGILLLLRRLVALGRGAGGKQTVLMKSLVGRMTDALHGIKPIKAMAREDDLRPLLEQETKDLNKATEQQVVAAQSMRAFQEPLLVLFLAIGLYLTITVGNQPFATVLVMAFLFYRLVAYMNQLQNHYQTMASCESAFWSLHEQTAAAEAEGEPSGSRTAHRVAKGIELRNIDFSYGDTPILRNVSLSIAAGEFLALVGSSGAGKTTLADLIIGLYRPDRGEVFIDDVPLKDLDLSSWRRRIGYVPQEMFLFHDTIFHNVTLGDETVSRESVEAALRTADAMKFVEALDQGMDTVVGERGSRLSGGQRQRLALARALVGDPDLLILDEVTASLDPATEAEICETLSELSGRLTIVSISHQAAMRDVADAVYCLEGGVIHRDRAISSVAVAG